MIHPLSLIMRRLTPLYLAAFFQGFVLWYAVEKLFMIEIGFNAATIGIMGASYAALAILIETPSGILADRWSRKGVLMIASIALAISSIICGLSTGVWQYIIGAGFWGIFYALYSGTYDSIVYDTLLEETGNSQAYERYYGRIRIMDSLALVLSALGGGLLGNALGLSATFYATVPFALFSILALVLFREPMLHKAHTAEPLLQHVKTTFKAISYRGVIGLIVAILVLVTCFIEVLMEFYQLWLIQLNAPLNLYGITAALIFGTIGAAGFITPYLNLAHKRTNISFCVVLLTSIIILILSRSLVVAIPALIVVAICLVSLNIMFLHKLHDQLPSQIRAGASSAINTLARIIFLFAAVLFGWVAESFTVFNAGWVLFVPLAIMSLVLYQSIKTKSSPQL